MLGLGLAISCCIPASRLLPARADAQLMRKTAFKAIEGRSQPRARDQTKAARNTARRKRPRDSADGRDASDSRSRDSPRNSQRNSSLSLKGASCGRRWRSVPAALRSALELKDLAALAAGTSGDTAARCRGRAIRLVQNWIAAIVSFRARTPALGASHNRRKRRRPSAQRSNPNKPRPARRSPACTTKSAQRDEFAIRREET